MEQNKTLYETVFIVNNTLGEEAVKSLVEKFTGLIAENGAIESVNEWGVRRFAYPIEDLTEGYYVLINFSSKPDFPQELERIYRITEGILRDIVIKKVEKKKRS